MQNLVPYLTALVTILGIVFFLGIVWWAWSSKQKNANDESAKLPFELPDEFSKEKS